MHTGSFARNNRPIEGTRVLPMQFFLLYHGLKTAMTTTPFAHC
jgi:hypothetical protein